MPFDIRWHCQQGTRTADNRDHAGIGIRCGSFLAVVLDGSTRGATSGLFAQEIGRRLVDWFVTGADATAETLTDQLRLAHAALARDFVGDSASYALVCAEATGPALLLHAGDCVAGRVDANRETTWLVQPHTLANAIGPVDLDILAKDPARHFLTRSFRSKRLTPPDQSVIVIDDGPLVIGTDGFWAEMDVDAQLAFLSGQRPSGNDERDDRGALTITRRDAHDGIVVIASGDQPANLYVRRV